MAKQSTAGCHDVDSIERCLYRNTPPSPGIALSLYSNTTSRSVARSLCIETPHRHQPSRVPSTETPCRYPASRGHYSNTTSDVRGEGQTSGEQVLWPIYGGGAHVREGRCPMGICPGGGKSPTCRWGRCPAADIRGQKACRCISRHGRATMSVNEWRRRSDIVHTTKTTTTKTIMVIYSALLGHA